ncbi:glutamate receptor: ionotropic kainate 3-like protein [Leptotrombidium deliense]|uniref:Glutamate receptor: ionotropic kainate 3-like protein n=1 Tax=Leptotrombidium deliense TaxID=299467 RepID=A0A443SLH2_9ACAR|nr:glutamate receptor: ionotropic kainate 3-like protein [Leptotrombidium deliense]
MAERETVVDFTVPFYDLVGFSILMKKRPVSSNLFVFVTVLDESVWYAILIAYLCTSFLLFILHRFSPYSHKNISSDKQLQERCRQFNLKECFWFCMTCLTPQGGGEAPKFVSARLLVANWWLFSFIFIATYTANLAAFLTVSNLESEIDSFEKLSTQYSINYSVIKKTIAYTYFQRRAHIENVFHEKWKQIAFNNDVNNEQRALLSSWSYPLAVKYTNIWKRMQNTGFEESYESALRRVMTSDYALIAEATYNRYTQMTNCKVVEVGAEFSRKPLALIVQKNLHIKEKLNYAILKLLNDKTLETLKDKWWDNTKREKMCSKNTKNSEGISIYSIGGVFVIIFAGIIITCFTLIVEYYNLRRRKTIVIDLPNSFAKRRTLFRSHELQVLPIIGTPIFYRPPVPYAKRELQYCNFDHVQFASPLV